MTAVAGFWSFADHPDPERRCAAMLATQEGYASGHPQTRVADSFAAGRDLLALVPEDEWDRQPLVVGDGRFVLVADVRLDDRDGLAAALAISARQAARLADSDLLARALLQWGQSAPERLLGDFAFAWFDRAERVLLLGRDPLGQRPLFWHRGHGFVAFASMPKGLHALDAIERSPDERAVADFLAQRDRSPEHSYFAGIRRVPPAHVVRVTPEASTSRRYWQPRPGSLRLSSFEDHVEAYRELLDRAVAARLRTRTRVVASHLSGGWDSGAVTATAARLFPGPVAAFTAVPAADQPTPAPRGRFANELPLAGRVAESYANVEHHVVEGNGASPLDQLDIGATWFERPLFNLCNHGWLAQIRSGAQARGAQVLLSGEIGNWTISAAPLSALNDYWRKHGWRKWWQAAHALHSLEQPRWRGILAATWAPELPAAVRRQLGRLSSVPAIRPVVHPALLDRWEPPAQGGRERQADQLAAFLGMDFGEHRKGILGRWKIDKRDPTSDVRLIEFCLSLPVELLVDRSGRRPLARAALADRLPRQVLDARAKGYQGADWHAGLGRDLGHVDSLIEEFAASPTVAGVIDVDRLRTIRRGWPEGGWESGRTIALYRNAFLQALTAGHFLLRASERMPARTRS